MKLPVPKELQEQLDHASSAMDAMNIKLDAVLIVLGDIRELLKEQQA